LVVAKDAKPAEQDAACLAGARAAGAVLVGKANLVELAFGATGINPWFGTPRNPLDPRLIPGGSSSGCAVAVATDEADVAYGTDTGGSIRIPSACCGTAGLKTTFGRVSLAGVRPLAPTLDTVGPMARNVDGILAGMRLLEPGFDASSRSPTVVWRVMLAQPKIERLIDAALARLGWRSQLVDLADTWKLAWDHGNKIICAEAAQANAALLDRLGELDPLVAVRLDQGTRIGQDELAAAMSFAARWRTTLDSLLSSVDLIVTSTLLAAPPQIPDAPKAPLSVATMPVNLAGLPALSLPIPSPSLTVPVSVQLVGPAFSEEFVVAAGLLLENELRTGKLHDRGDHT